MAEFCLECSIRYLGPESAKYAGGLCKKGKTATMLCEGCGDIVEVDHEGRLVAGECGNEVQANPGSFWNRISEWLRS